MEGRLSVQRGLQILEVLLHQRKIAFSPLKFITGHILAGMQQQLLGAGGFGNGENSDREKKNKNFGCV